MVLVTISALPNHVRSLFTNDVYHNLTEKAYVIHFNKIRNLIETSKKKGPK